MDGLYYVYQNMELYGTEYPVCFEYEEALKIWLFELKDRGMLADEFPFIELFREATDEEIEDYGIAII